MAIVDRTNLGRPRTALSVLGRRLDVIDDIDVERTASGFEFEAEVFL